jgi:hypothetical protein
MANRTRRDRRQVHIIDIQIETTDFHADSEQFKRLVEFSKSNIYMRERNRVVHEDGEAPATTNRTILPDKGIFREGGKFQGSREFGLLETGDFDFTGGSGLELLLSLALLLFYIQLL